MLFSPQPAKRRWALTRPKMKYKTSAQGSFYTPWYLNMGLLNYSSKQILQLHVRKSARNIFQTPEGFWSAVTLPTYSMYLLFSVGGSFEAGRLSYSIAKNKIRRRWKLKSITSTFSMPVLRSFFRIKILNFWAEMYYKACFIEECCQTVFKYNLFLTFFSFF